MKIINQLNIRLHEFAILIKLTPRSGNSFFFKYKLGIPENTFTLSNKHRTKHNKHLKQKKPLNSLASAVQ